MRYKVDSRMYIGRDDPKHALRKGGRALLNALVQNPEITHGLSAIRKERLLSAPASSARAGDSTSCVREPTVSWRLEPTYARLPV
jgi:hypothetical protein